MINLAQRETKLMVAVHGWSGILLGLLLYAVVVTGTAAVFADEIGTWSAGHVATQSAFARPHGKVIERLGAQTPSKYREAVDLFETGDHDLGVFFHRHETDAAGNLISRGVFYRLDEASRVVEQRPATNEEVFGATNDNALSSFLVETHVRLHVPNPWGLLLTGILGLAMLVAAVSGLLIHRHLFKDIFTLRRAAKPVLFNRDRHNVAGTWSLPFAFVLAFTGSFFSFYGTVGIPIVAMAAFGGDVEALNETVYGNPGKPDARPAAMSGTDRAFADAIRRAGDAPTFAAIENFGRADAKLTTYHPPSEGGLAPISLLYEAGTGAFVQVKPLIGQRPSTGGTLAAIMSPLHFGNFAGVLSKGVWFGLGFAMCYVIYTGLRLWLVRREAEARSLDWLSRSVVVVGLGLPLALLVTAAVFLLTKPLDTAVYWVPTGFVLASLALIVAGAVWSSAAAYARALVLWSGLAMLALPILRLVTGGPGWSTALTASQPVIVALDCALLLAGGWMTWQRLGSHLRSGRSDRLVLEPAE